MLVLEIDLLRFTGHLHPLVVHLPIGFMLLGILFYFLKNKSRYNFLDKALPLTLFLSMVSAALASLFGWLLANDGGYAESTLFWHRWSGIALTALSALAWLWSIGKIGNGNRKLGAGILVACTILLFLAGHYGGQLTHGADYLKKALVGEGAKAELQIPDHPDSILVYTHLIQPVLEHRCYSCHNEKTQNGGLDLSSWEALQKGGDNGAVLEADAHSSEIFKRVTLPQNSKKFMPTKGEPMTFTELSVLQWWINEGAKPEVALTALTITDDIKLMLERSYGIDTRIKPFVERIKVDPLVAEVIDEVRTAGWKVNNLGADNNLLEVSPLQNEKISDDQLAKLSAIASHITWMDLSNAGLNDDQLKALTGFSNLSRLRLQNNQITDAGLVHLSGLENLESLNLYNNPVTDDGLSKLADLPALKRLYLWQTKVTEKGKNDFKSKRSDVEL